MGNKLGHGEGPDASSAVSKATGKKAATASKSGSIDGGHAPHVEDHGEDPVAEVPPPMDPIAPLPVTSASDKLEFTSTPELDLKPNDSSCDSEVATAPDPAPVITADSVEKNIQERSYRLQVG